MSIAGLKYSAILNLKNIPGPTVKKKIVVFECDDYGGVRMPSNEAFKQMRSAGVMIDDSRYNLYDTLEDENDLSALFETLTGVKDKNGKPAVFSPFVNVANPDFDKIKDNGFKQYFYEPFTTTLQKYGRSNNTMLVWMQGMNEGVFMPEFHGREHVSVQPWLSTIQQGNPQLKFAVGYGFAAVVNVPGIHDYAQGFRPEFYFTSEDQKQFLHRSIVEGVKLFEQIFAYTPTAFMPSNSVFHPDFEETVLQTGIPFLVVAHKNLTPGDKGNLKFTNFTFRQRIQKGKLNFYIRNCAFEPNDDAYSSIDSTLQQMSAAFRWHKPAIISTHRVNFVGGLNKANRDKGLNELKKLLQAIVQRWPDVEFMSTSNMLKELKK